MKKILYSAAWILAVQFFLFACQESEPELGAIPTADDATFTFTPTTANENIVTFTSPSSAFLKKWDFGNGTKAEGNTVNGTFPLKGTYEVTLTVFTSGGSISTKQTIEIAETDPTLLDIPIYNQLTGGKDDLDGKTWVIDAATAAHFGVGAGDAIEPNYYKAGANEKAGAGMYDDKYTFKLDGFSFTQETNGDVFINSKQAANFPGAQPASGDFKAPYTAPTNLTWTITEDTDANQVLTIGPSGGFIGYYTGTSAYRILSISENVLYLRYLDAADPGLTWYIRLIPDGFTPVDPKTTLPVDFQGDAPPFNGFGGTAFSVVDNPASGGINTSTRVGKYVKGTEGSWAGIETMLSAKLDFSEKNFMKYKVYSPVTGRALFKLEAADGSATPVEVFVNVTKVNEWEDLSFDFSAVPADTYNKIAMFLDFDNNAGGTFHIDDIRQVADQAPLTLAALIGGGSKAWVLKPAAGSFAVGSSKGSDNYYPQGQDLSGVRPCLFNDEFIFKTGGVYQYDTKGDIFGEGYMGITPDGCTSDANLPANAQAWGSGTHTFTFTPATDIEPAYIAVKGTGAFIVLPKAYNGGEYSAAPPPADAEVTYEVLSYVKNGSNETLTLTIDVSGTGATFWSFTLIPK